MGASPTMNNLEDNIEAIRNEFPVLKYLTYLNCAAHGPGLERCWKAVTDWWRFTLYEHPNVKAPNIKGELSRMIGCKLDEVTPFNRVSHAINAVSDMMQLNKGENIVTTDLAYPSNIYPWIPQYRRGVEIKRVKSRGGLIDTADFEKNIDDNTKVVSISRVEWTSGLLHDVKAIAEIAHDHGALVLDDGYQAQGNVVVDVSRDKVDFYTFGSQKWLCCPSMAGALYVKRDHWADYEPHYRCYNRVEEAFRSGAPWERPEHDNIKDYDKPLVGDAEKYNQGLLGEDALWGFHASLEYFNKLGTINIQDRNRKLSGYLIGKLKDLGVKVNTPDDPKRRGGLVTFTTNSHQTNQKLFKALKDEGIIVALRYAGGVGGIRVSTQFYNTEDDIDKLCNKIKEILK